MLQLLALTAVIGGTCGLVLATWCRLARPLLGDPTVAAAPESTLWIATLAGLAVAMGVLATRASGSLSSALAWTAPALLLPYALGDRLALLALLLRPMSSAGEVQRLIGWGGIVLPLVAPAAFLLGVALGRLLPLLATRRRQLATGALGSAGLLAGWNAAHSGLLTWLGVHGAWRGAAVVWLLLAIWAALVQPSGRPRSLWPIPFHGLALPIVMVLLWVLPGPTELSLHSPIAAGSSATVPKSFASANALRHWLESERRALRWSADGATHGVAVATYQGAELRFDGRPVGGLANAPAEVMTGLIGAALHPAPNHALLLGLGTGVTAGWLTAVPEIERVDIAESEPAVERAAADFAGLNRKALDHPKVRLTATAPSGTYDLVVIDSSGSPSTRLYRSAARRLGPGGLLLHARPRVGLHAARRSLLEVLPHIDTWHLQPERVLLVASAAPIPMDPQRLRTLASREPYPQAQEWLWGVEGLDGLLSGHAPSEATAETATSGVERARAIRRAYWGGDVADPAFAAFQRGDLRRARIEWALAGRVASSPFERLLVAESSAELTDPRVPEMAAELRPQRPIEADAVMARWHLRQRQLDAALRHLSATFEAARQQPYVYRPTLRRALELAVEIGVETPRRREGTRQLFDVLAEPFAAWLLDDTRLRTRVELANQLGGDPCVEALEAFEPHPPWEDDFLRQRAACYKTHRHSLAESATRDVEAFKSQAPSRIEHGLLSGRGRSEN